MLRHNPSFESAILLGLVILAFCYVQPTTADRLASLAFGAVVIAYALATRRPDVLLASLVFFVSLSLNLYLLNSLWPAWIELVILPIIFALFWLIFRPNHDWLLAITAVLLSLELNLASQYINLEPKVQALFISLPFILASQSAYFQGLTGVIS